MVVLNTNDAYVAVRTLLADHARESQRFEEIASYLRPWNSSEAAAKLGADTSGKNGRTRANIARMSQAPFLGLVLDTYGQSLKVDGFFNSEEAISSSWQWWQRNKMDAKQTGLHRAALQYGTAYASVLPAAEGGAKIEGYSPRRMVARYGEALGLPDSPSSDEYPIIAMAIDRHYIRLYDEQYVYFFGAEHVPSDPMQWLDRAYYQRGNLQLLEKRAHDVGATPIVRYQDRMLLDGEQQRGIIEPLIGLADRINQTNYEQGIAQYFAAFKQRYVIGWMPDDARQAFKQSVADTQFFDDPDVKVGQYEETDLTRYIDSRQATVRDLAAVAQVPAQALGANAISNISADGLAALETSKDRKVSEIQTSLGESHEQLLRLASHVTGDDSASTDFGAEVKWAETSARSFAQTVDGLGKLATMLGIPAEELWADIPGWTKERVDRVKKARGEFPDMAGLFYDDGEDAI